MPRIAWAILLIQIVVICSARSFDEQSNNIISLKELRESKNYQSEDENPINSLIAGVDLLSTTMALKYNDCCNWTPFGPPGWTPFGPAGWTPFGPAGWTPFGPPGNTPDHSKPFNIPPIPPKPTCYSNYSDCSNWTAFGPPGWTAYGPPGWNPFGPAGWTPWGPEGLNAHTSHGSRANESQVASKSPDYDDCHNWSIFGPPGWTPFGPPGWSTFGPPGWTPWGPPGNTPFDTRPYDTPEPPSPPKCYHYNTSMIAVLSPSFNECCYWTPFGPPGYTPFGPPGWTPFGPPGWGPFGPPGNTPSHVQPYAPANKLPTPTCQKRW